MAALTSSRNTPELADLGRIQVYPVEAGTIIYLGSMVALNAAGNAVPASNVSGLKLVGRAERVHNGIPGQNADNTGGSAGAISVVCRRGVFRFADGDSSIGSAQIGSLAFAVDDNSVSANDGTITQVTSQAVTFDASSAPQVMPLGHAGIVRGSVVVKNSGNTVTYVENTDYVVGYDAGLLALVGGAIAPASTVNVSYQWSNRSRSVAGTIVNLDSSGQIWIDFTRQSASAL
jgi:hypothetical protein